MIQTIGILISGYVILRCIDLLAANRDRFSGTAGANIVKVGAALGLLASVLCGVSILLSTP